jgi:cyclic beta-1,2-glucan synthetase
LIFPNGLGGFTRDGHEYVITLEPGRMTPAPWVNVLANPHFGTVVSESGSAYTWVENAHEFRLTPWSNDPVQDPTGEASTFAMSRPDSIGRPPRCPRAGPTPYVIRHGFGYTVFEHTENGIASELWVYVAMDAPVKFTVLKLRNVSGRPRRLVRHRLLGMGAGRLAAQTACCTCRPKWTPRPARCWPATITTPNSPGRIVFIDVNDPAHGHRRSAGVPRPQRQPVRTGGAQTRAPFRQGRRGTGSVRRGAGRLRFAAGQERETSFRLGVGRDAADVQNLIQRFRRADASRVALEGSGNTGIAPSAP